MSVAIEQELAPGVPSLSCEASEIHQVLGHLVIKAAEARVFLMRCIPGSPAHQAVYLL